MKTWICSFLKISFPIVFALFTVFLVFSFFSSIECEDGWWHLSAGRWIIENQRMPQVDVFSTASHKTPWIYSQWLGGVLFYAIYLVGQVIGLQIFRAVLFLCAILIFFGYGYRRLPQSLLFFLSYLVFCGLWPRVILRPFIFNFIFVQLLIICIYRYIRTTELRYLFYIFPLGVVWSNFHLGSFVYGIFILGVFVLSFGLDYFLMIRSSGLSDKVVTAKGRDLRNVFIALLIYILSFLFNPYGWQGFLHPFKVFLVPNYINFYKYNLMVGEMLPPGNLFMKSWWWFFALAGFVLFAIVGNKKMAWHDALFVLLPFYAFLRIYRAIGLLAILWGYVVLNCADKSNFKSRWQSFKYSYIVDLVLVFCLIIVFGFGIYQRFQKFHFLNDQFQKDIALNVHPTTPQKTLNILRQINAKGLVFNNERYGGYLIWQAYQEIIPFVDGRQLDQVRFMRYVDTLVNPEQYWPILEQEFNFQVAILDSSGPIVEKIIKYLIRNPDWQLISLEGFVCLFVRRGSFDLPDDLKFFEDRLQQQTLTNFDIEGFDLYGRLRNQKETQFFNARKVMDVDLLQEAQMLSKVGYQAAAVKRISIYNRRYINTFE